METWNIDIKFDVPSYDCAKAMVNALVADQVGKRSELPHLLIKDFTLEVRITEGAVEYTLLYKKYDSYFKVETILVILTALCVMYKELQMIHSNPLSYTGIVTTELHEDEDFGEVYWYTFHTFPELYENLVKQQSPV